MRVDITIYTNNRQSAGINDNLMADVTSIAMQC